MAAVASSPFASSPWLLGDFGLVFFGPFVLLSLLTRARFLETGDFFGDYSSSALDIQPDQLSLDFKSVPVFEKSEVGLVGLLFGILNDSAVHSPFGTCPEDSVIGKMDPAQEIDP